MSDKHGKTEYTIEQEPSTYQTGSTQPPKSYMGVILVLLGLVIFLGGIATFLGFTNIRLFQALTAQKETTPNAVGFSYADGQEVTGEAQKTGLGFSGETVSEFWHTYHQLPRGIFIQCVDENSDAALQGVLPGDILIRVNGNPITSIEELEALLAEVDDTTVSVVLYRNAGEISLRLPVDK